MNALTKDEVQKLEPHLQEALAASIVSRIEHRQRLLATAQGKASKANIVTAIISTAIFFAFLFFMKDIPMQPMLFGVVLLSWVIGYVSSVEKRIDALIELSEFDAKNEDLVE
jgi:hypothetical protein